jgi:site-specific DNA recombinase
MRAAPYARISKEDVGNVDNTDIQLDECLAWITENGHDLAGTYVDNNISAYSNTRRPDYERLLRDVEANKIDIIVCTEPSRLNRNLRNSISLIALAYTTKLQHIAVTDPERHGFDLSTKSGIQNALEAAIEDEKEVTRLSGRQKRKQRVRAKEGKRNGGPRPFGYEADGMTIRESEAAIIREVVRRLLDGESSRSIIMDLRRRGVKTSTGKEWHGHTLRRLISSPRIAGIRIHLGTHYKAQWPAIISEEDWQQVQVVWRARARHGTVTPRRYLLTGILFCGNCDTPMVGQTWHDTRRPETVTGRYRCAKDEAYYHRSGCGKIFALPTRLTCSSARLSCAGWTPPTSFGLWAPRPMTANSRPGSTSASTRKTRSASCLMTGREASSIEPSTSTPSTSWKTRSRPSTASSPPCRAAVPSPASRLTDHSVKSGRKQISTSSET